MADKIKTEKQSGGVNAGRDAKAGRDIIGGNKITVIGTGAVIIVVIAVVALTLLSPIINKPPIPPALSPTPLAFQPAGQDETLLIVADFDDRSAGQYSGIDPAQRIYELITGKLPGSNMKLRVEQYHQPLKDSAEARRILNQYGATLLIWGWYDKLGAEPNVELDKDRIALSNPQMHEVSLATPESFVIRFTKDIPSQSAYLAFFSLGMMQLDLDRVAATAFFTQAIDSASQVSADSVNPWEALMWRGNIYAWGNEHNLAINDYTEALKLYPHREGYFNRGASYTAQGKYYEAIADYKQALAIDPNYKEAYVNLGVTNGLQGHYDDSITDFTNAIEIDSRYESAYYNRCVSYFFKGNYDAVIADCTQATTIDPQNNRAYLFRANAHKAQGAYEKAFADYKQAIAIDPQYREAYDERGNAFADQKQYKEAIADYQKSIELGPSAYTYCVMGITYTKIGDFPSAITALEQGVRLDTKSENQWCKTALDNARLGMPIP